MNWNSEISREKYSSPMLPASKQLITFFVGWVGLQIIATFVQLFFMVVGKIQGEDLSAFLRQDSISMLINAIVYFALLGIIVGVNNTHIIAQFKSFKQWQSLLAGVVCFFAIIAFSNVYGVLIEVLQINVTENVNQAAIESTQNAYPFTALIVFGFVAPVCEELTYRAGLFSFLKRKNRTLAYVVTVLVFALIHSNFTASNFVNELLNLPHYMFAGFAFSFTYEYFGFGASTTAHMINNIIGCLPAFFQN